MAYQLMNAKSHGVNHQSEWSQSSGYPLESSLAGRISRDEIMLTLPVMASGRDTMHSVYLKVTRRVLARPRKRWMLWKAPQKPNFWVQCWSHTEISVWYIIWWIQINESMPFIYPIATRILMYNDHDAKLNKGIWFDTKNLQLCCSESSFGK